MFFVDVPEVTLCTWISLDRPSNSSKRIGLENDPRLQRQHYHPDLCIEGSGGLSAAGDPERDLRTRGPGGADRDR